MNRYKKIIYFFVIMLLIVIIAVSSYLLLVESLEEKKQVAEFEELEEIVEVSDETEKVQKNHENIEVVPKEENNNNNVNANTNTKEEKSINVAKSIDLQKLYNINSDLVGWIRIDGTNINYPVMQNTNFYLRKNFYKKYSNCGTPYLAEYCNLKTSDNLILYGHHMNNKTMFSSLNNYKSFNYYKNHQYVKFYTLEDGVTIENTYEVIFAFKTTAYSEDGFKYSSFYKANSEEQYNEFITKCQELSFYNTGKTASYGDKLITLSTCEYSQKNGRMVVVAKKI